MVLKREEKKDANKSTRIVDSGKRRNVRWKIFSVPGGVCQKMRNIKLREVAEKYIYKCVLEYIYETNGNGREHVLNGKNAGFGKKYSKNIFPRVTRNKYKLCILDFNRGSCSISQ